MEGKSTPIDRRRHRASRKEARRQREEEFTSNYLNADWMLGQDIRHNFAWHLTLLRKVGAREDEPLRLTVYANPGRAMPVRIAELA